MFLFSYCFYCVLFRVWRQFLRAACLCQRFFEQNFSLFCRAISHFRQVRKSSPYSRRFCLIFGNCPLSDVIEPARISSESASKIGDTRDFWSAPAKRSG